MVSLRLLIQLGMCRSNRRSHVCMYVPGIRVVLAPVYPPPSETVREVGC